jgi:hypothetical protein
MQKPVNQRQLSWRSSETILTAERFLDFAKEIQTISEFGPIQNHAVTFSGGVLPIQLTGVPNEVSNDFEQISDKRFVSANTKAVFPQANNLTFTVSANIPLGQVNINIQNGTDESAEKLFLLVAEAFPRASGPSDQEIDQQSLRLSALIKEAEKSVQASKKSQESLVKTTQNENAIKTALENILSVQNEATKLAAEIKEFAAESSQKVTEISNYRNQSQTDRETSQKFRDDIGAIEAKIREFFNEIEGTRKDISKSSSLANETVQSCKAETEQIIQENISLQKETKEHLLKAVGASLFSAFEKRKKRIELSKWVWAGFTITAIIAQVFVIMWIANHVQALATDIPFYKTPSFLLRVTVSIPILFFIGYSIHQYSREREYEEFYGFKSSISFSLSPYLDLVKKLNEEQDSNNGEHTQFVIDTIKQIFDNPVPLSPDVSKKDKTDSTLLKDLLDRAFKIIEKGK